MIGFYSRVGWAPFGAHGIKYNGSVNVLPRGHDEAVTTLREFSLLRV
jgi:hypothetical protein